MPAVYLSLTIDGAVAEAAQGFAGKLEPLTICLYSVDCRNIADLSSQESRAAVDVNFVDLSCPWALDVAEGRKPMSWLLARRLIADSYSGALVPPLARNARPDMTNLVLWKWGAHLPCGVNVHDPSGRLPKDQLSWRR